MDGNAPVYGSLCAYGDGEESAPVTIPSREKGVRVLHDLKPDRIRKGVHKRPAPGGRVSDLIKALENPTRVYDPGVDLKPKSPLAMSSIDGGGDHGGTAKDHARPKPPTGDELALIQSNRQLVVVAADENLDSNWAGVAAEGRNGGPETMLEGEVNLEDEFCMEEEEEEAVAVPPSQPKVWRMLARYYSLKAANYSLLQKHLQKVWRIRTKMYFKPLKELLGCGFGFMMSLGISKQRSMES
jgi:hypothetical protein